MGTNRILGQQTYGGFAPRPAKPGELRRSQVFVHRVISTLGDRTTILYRGEDRPEAMRVFEVAAKKARDAGTEEKIALDDFTVEERETWTARQNLSTPPKPVSIRRTAKGGKLRILYAPLETPVWTSARGWTYSANLAYAKALRDLGHEVTVLNTLTIQYREALKNGGPFDQVWTHVHFRHATDHYYREWLANAAPVRVGLSGESVFYTEEQKLSSPWYAEQTKAFEDWRPFLTHCAFVGGKDSVNAREDSRRGRWKANPELRIGEWKQAVPRAFIGPVIEKPKTDLGIFCGAAYAPRDQWIFHPALRKLLAKPRAPEGPGFDAKFLRTHQMIHTWMKAIGAFPDAALALYHARLSSLRAYAARKFIQAIGQGSCVVNLPSMVQAYSGRVTEGMAAGRPVVSWAPAGDEGLFDHLPGAGQEIVHYGDSPESLAEAIEAMQRDPARANRIAANARAKILAEHTVEKRTADLVAWACDET